MKADLLEAVESAESLLKVGGFAKMATDVIAQQRDAAAHGIREIEQHRILLLAQPEQVAELERIASSFQSASADVLVAAARICDGLDNIDRTATFLKRALEQASTESREITQIFELLLASAHRSELLKRLQAKIPDDLTEAFQKLTSTAMLLDSFERCLMAASPDLGRAKAVAASLTWPCEWAKPHSLPIALEGASAGRAMLKKWRLTTRRPLLPEEKSDYYEILYSLSGALLLHPRATLEYFQELREQYLLLVHIPKILPGGDERSASLTALLHEARRCALSLSESELQNVRNLACDLWRPLADICVALALRQLDGGNSQELLCDAIKHYKNALGVLPADQTVLASDICRSIGSCCQVLARNTVAEDRGDYLNYLRLAEDWLVRSAIQAEPGLDIRTEPIRRSRNIGLHLQLASLYAQTGEKEASAIQIAFEICDSIPDKAEQERIFHMLAASTWFSRFQRYSWPEVVAEILEHATHTLPSLRGGRALLGLYRLHLKGPRKSAQIGSVIERLLKLGCQLKHPEITALSTRFHLILKDSRQMAAYINACRASIESGSSASLLSDFPDLLEADRFLSYDGTTADDLLLTFLANALLAVGNVDQARQTLITAYEADDSPRNHGEVWQLRGDILMAEGRHLHAAEAFERSYREGGEESFGPLLKAAKAYSKGGQHDRSVLMLYAILSSGRDSAPLKSRTELARALWARYTSHPEHSGRTEDVVEACAALMPILSGVIGFPGDTYAAEALVAMASHEYARNAIVRLLRTGLNAARQSLLSRLVALGQFHSQIVAAVLGLVDVFQQLERGTEQFADFLMGAWVDAYFRLGPDDFAAFIKASVTVVLARVAKDSFWSLVLACNKTAIVRRLEKAIQAKARDAVDALLGHSDAATLESVRHEVQSDLYDRLDTQLLDITPRAYRGREPGTSLRDRLISIKEHDCDRSVGDPCVVPEFQALWTTAFLLRVRDAVNDSSSPLCGRIESTSITLRSGATADVMLTLKLPEAMTAQEQVETYTLVANLSLIDRWQAAIRSFASGAIRLRHDLTVRAIVVSVSIPTTNLEEDSDWDWMPFYNHVVKDTFNNVSLGASYYASAFRLIPPILSFQPDVLTDYVLAQMDGLFSQVYRSRHYQLASVSHTVHKIVAALSFTDPPNSTELLPLLEELRQEVLSVHGRDPDADCDLGVALTEVANDCVRLDSRVICEVSLPGPSALAIIRGNSTLIRRALLDILANAIAAMNEQDEVERRVLLRLARGAQSLVVSVLNSGPSEPTQGGFGIGTKTIEYVMDHHRGSAKSGPLEGEDPYHYGWRLEFPIGRACVLQQ